jgi:hypothetical protein
MEATMRPRSPNMMRCFIIGVFCCLSVVGCASFPGKQLPIYTYEQIAPQDPKPSIDYDAKFISLGRENAAAVRILQEEIEKVFNRSNLFSTISAGIGSEKYHLSIVLKDEGNVALAFLSGFISGLTFAVLPAYGRDEYVLSVDVKKGDQLLKQYQYKDHMNSWIQLFLIVLTPTHWPPDVAKNIIDNMLLNFLHDVENDKILEVLPESH